MRCPDCNKFVSFDTDSDPESDINVDDVGNVDGSCRIVNTCQDCGTELKEATLEIEASVEDDVEKHRKEHGWSGEGEVPEGHRSLSVEAEMSRTERMQSHDRRGKLIRNRRYMKHLYGAEGSITVTCECGETFSTQWSDEVSGSGMEEMV